jgi:hypothetical protein
MMYRSSKIERCSDIVFECSEVLRSRMEETISDGKTIMPPPVRSQGGAIDLGKIKRETRTKRETRLVVNARIPGTGKVYKIRTPWFDPETKVDISKVVMTVKQALVRFLSTGKGLKMAGHGVLDL